MQQDPSCGTATRQLPPGLREEVRQESVTGPKEDGLSLPCVWVGVGWGADRGYIPLTVEDPEQQSGGHPASPPRPHPRLSTCLTAQRINLVC